jgi:Icc-related predicted phosphoesterase
MIIDCISDLHGYYPELEGGDLLIVAGDLTAQDMDYEYWKFNKWITDQSYLYGKVIVIAGNHDNLLIQTADRHMAHAYCHPAEYLCDSETEFEGLKIWGSPWTKTFEGMNPHCKAFTLDSEQELKEKWKLIPEDSDILVTHSPPRGILDQVEREDVFIEGHQCDILENVGSSSLQNSVASKRYVLKLHVFGHIHEAYGIWDIRNIQKELGDPITPIFVNASHVNERYQPVNKPVRIVL